MPRITTAIKSVSLRHFVFVLFLSALIIYSIIFLSGRRAAFVFNSYITNSLFISMCILLLFLIFIFISVLFKKERQRPLTYSAIVLSPIMLLPLWRPEGAYPSVLIPIAIIVSTQILFFIILSKEDRLSKISVLKPWVFILGFIILYFTFFSYLDIQKLKFLSFFNPRDVATYNQTFWNTLHGRFFLNSAYGSYFACHNSPFYLLLVPFYYIWPHPLTLLILRTLLLSLSVIPFFLIAKNMLGDIAAIPLTFAFLFYPYIVSQNLTPPHEMGYAPFFILFAYYFFRQNKFLAFMLFLIISVCVKEHLSLVALMFGVFSLFNKKGLKWILAPSLLGIFWAIFSLLIILRCQKVYQSPVYSSWFWLYLKSTFSDHHGNALTSLVALVSSSNIGSWYRLKSIFLLFTPLGVIPPLLSPIGLLGLPEFLIAILSDRPALLDPLRHYCVVASCFLSIAAIDGIKRISRFKLLISVFILAATLMHSYLWIPCTQYTKNKNYIETVNEALSIIPKNAFVTAPANIAVQISNREKYSLVGEGGYGDYIILDKNNLSLISDTSTSSNYNQIFNKEGIVVLKKSPKELR